MKKCEACEEGIKEHDSVIQMEDGEVYHEKCCSIHPQAYSVFVDGDYVGDTNEDFLDAWDLLSDSDYESEEDEG